MYKFFKLFLLLQLMTVWAISKNMENPIAVRDLDAQGVKANEAAIISEQLRAELIKSPSIQLIERNQMKEILEEQEFQQSDCSSSDCAVEIGQLLGVKYIVVGTVGIAGSYTILNVRIIDVESGAIIVNEAERTKGGIDKVLEIGIKSIAHKLTQALFPSSNNTETSPIQKEEKKSSLGRNLLIGSGVTALIGGSIAAALILNQSDTPTEDKNKPNTRIYLP